MQVSPGSRLGPYEVVSRLGAGGMGEVWRARDARLDRDVAVKILPAEFADDAQFRTRFEREAKTISQLNHPNICTLHDVGDGYLVMELVDGESLADRVQRGPMPLADVLRCGIHIASALDRAHRRGIIHRDLKPGNVMLTREGAKLLDFGLAKSSSGALMVSGSSSLTGETEHKPLTAEGTIVGTFQYMAPEQIEGREADARSDIFALGTVLYEMATGRRAFDGKSRASLIASILDREPAPISEVQPLSPASFENIVRKCLAKDPEDRWQSAHDVKLQLQWLVDHTDGPAVPQPRRKSRAVPFVAIVVALVAIGISAAVWWKTRSTAKPTRFSFATGDGRLSLWGASGVAVSPDGRSIVWSSGAPATQLWIRHLDTDSVTPIDGTAGASRPFFSPDGQWVAFFSGRFLKKIPQTGGSAQTVATLPGVPIGGTWLHDDTIVWATEAGVYHLGAAGGTPALLHRRSGGAAQSWFDTALREPFAMAGSDEVLFESGSNAAPVIGMLNVKNGTWREITDGAAPSYVDRTGALLFVRNGTLFGAKFDRSAAKLTSPAVPLIEGVVLVAPYYGADVGVSPNGTVAYARGNLSGPPRRLVSVDRAGNIVPLSQLTRGFEDPRISPDGRRIAVTIRSTSDTDVWIFDVQRGVLSRMTFNHGEDETPIWTPDGRRITWGAERGTAAAPQGTPASVIAGVERSLMWQPFDGSGTEEMITICGHGHAASWSPDGKTLAFSEYRPDFVGEVWVWSAVEKKKRPFVANGYNARAPAFSHDGKWLAYTSNESGRDEIYVRPFPGPGAVVQVSSEGGSEPLWSRSGTELFFRNGEKMMASRYRSGSEISFDPPRILFSGDFLTARRGEAAYDVMPDDQHFLMIQQDQDPASQKLNVIVDWLGELEAKLKTTQQ